jgi:hypothetical protein
MGDGAMTNRAKKSALRYLEALSTEVRDSVNNGHQDLRTAVARARTAKATWAEVGTALGTSRQAAQERFGRFEER